MLLAFWNLAASLLIALPFAIGQDSVSHDIDTYGSNDPSGTPFQTYMSNTDVKPPQLQINSNQSGLASGYVFIGVDGEPTSSQNWPAIFGMRFLMMLRMGHTASPMRQLGILCLGSGTFASVITQYSK